MNKTDVAILIPVHNGLSFTSGCLSNLYQQLGNTPTTEIDYHVIVIDDGSNDGTGEWIKANYPQTILIEGDGNFWWSGGINAGTRYALEQLQCGYILWWNNDISPASDYFINLNKLIAAGDLEIAGSKIYYAHSPQLVWSMGGIFNTRNGRKYMTGMNEPDSVKFEKSYAADWLPGMGTILHRSVIGKIGLLDNENFPQYHGDSDFTFRATLAGYHIRVFPQLRIWNDKSNSGLLHRNKFSLLLQSLHDVKSNYHFGKDLRFYRKYATSPLAYKTLAIKYCLYIGGFLKWRLLELFGFKKNQSL